jgi:excisionase family DNA binding protein
MKESKTMSVRQAALALGVSIQHVYHLIWEESLLSQKIDGQWRVSAEAVESRLKARGE